MGVLLAVGVLLPAQAYVPVSADQVGKLANVGIASAVEAGAPVDLIRVALAAVDGASPPQTGNASTGAAPDLTRLVSRTAVLTALAILTILAFGIWLGIGERSYLYLALALAAHLVCTASSGGELALLPWLGPLIGNDPRTPHFAAIAAVLAGFVFASYYLDMDLRHRRMASILRGCDIALLVLLGLTLLAEPAGPLVVVAALVVSVGTAAVITASIHGLRTGQRAAGFLLLSWLPMLAVLVLWAGDFIGAWSPAAWVEHMVNAAPALSGLLLTIGLTDTLQQLRRDRDHASHMATYDALTGVLARPVIEERLHTLVAQAHVTGRPLALVFFDIDRFKMVNDFHGHRVGDSCLRIIALRTRNRLRTYDVLGRWGGDELLVILPDTRLGEALGVAENLRSAVNCRSLSVDGRLFDASLSLGVAELAAGETAEHLLERADAALYASKSAGRDRVTGQGHQRFVDPEPGTLRRSSEGPARGAPES